MYKPNAQCAVLCGYSKVVASNIPAIAEGRVTALNPQLDNLKLYLFYDKPERFMPVRKALVEFDPVTAPSQEEFSEALDKAIRAQRRFDEECVAGHRKAVEWLFSDKSRKAALLGGRIYHLVENQLRGLDEKLSARGFAVLSPRGTKRTLGVMDYPDGADPTFNHGSFLQWLADSSIEEGPVNIVFLQSANCGYDAISVAEAQKILADGNRYSAAIVLDDDPARIDEQIEAFTRDCSNERSRHELEGDESLSPAQAIELLVDSYQEKNIRKNADKRLADLPYDLCNTVSMLFSNSYRLFESDPTLTEVHLPAICEDCLVDSLPALLSRNLGRDVRVVWDEEWEFAAESPISAFPFAPVLSNTIAEEPLPLDPAEVVPSAGAVLEDGYTPTIGIVGNPLLCLNPTLSCLLVDLIEKNGGHALLPDSRKLHSASTDYLEQLQEYARQGVDGVLYLQDANCLKESVDGRGTIRELQGHFPHMHLTVVNLGKDTTLLTLGNRVSLAICTAYDRHRGL